MLALALRARPAPAPGCAVPAGRASTASTIWSTVCCVISLPHIGAVRHADAGIQQAQIVVNLGHGAHGGAGVFGGGLLVDGNGRGQAVNLVDIRLVHLPQKLPCIGGQRLHIPPLPLGIDACQRPARIFQSRKARSPPPACHAGYSTLIFFRLWARAPRITIWSVTFAMPPERYFFLLCANFLDFVAQIGRMLKFQQLGRLLHLFCQLVDQLLALLLAHEISACRRRSPPWRRFQ